MDWSGCSLVETHPGKISDVSFIKGTTLAADQLMNWLRAGLRREEIAQKLPMLSSEEFDSLLTYAIERLNWDEKTLVDWSGCALVEQVPGRCSGAHTIVGTRIFPDTIAKYYWSGASMEEMREDYPSLSIETIRGLIGYLKQQEASAA